MGLKAPLKEGDMVKGQLTFEKAGKVDVEFKIDSIGASAPTHDHAGGAMKMDGMKMDGKMDGMKMDHSH